MPRYCHSHGNVVDLTTIEIFLASARGSGVREFRVECYLLKPDREIEMLGSITVFLMLL